MAIRIKLLFHQKIKKSYVIRLKVSSNTSQCLIYYESFAILISLEEKYLIPSNVVPNFGYHV